ncbi:serine/threonine-protein kinase [Prosthecobacter sp.]|uniref:serine/threonine-protein kinase n=1 Tax=Prosthecobacter sp. TaxID=1965333 RepID=UPI001DC8904E|nr:serine/threonine-protein kinase [Prosthecobacter sp.]MCB1278813.1 serine/threonine protein kinase [Prosthecobacter sp.]
MTFSDPNAECATVAVQHPIRTFAPEALPPSLTDLHPRHLLKLGIDAYNAPPSPEGWHPPTAEELEERFHKQGLAWYTIRKELGHGAMGAVYEAYHLQLDASIAVKIMRPGSAFNDPQFRKSFRDEARIMFNLEHPGLVRVFDSGFLAGGTDTDFDGSDSGDVFFFSMDLLVGNELRAEFRKGPLTEERAIDIFGQICATVALAHENNVIHRDLKPENIFLTDSGVVKVLDFGLARRDDNPLDKDHALKAAGTPAYMAPEQLKHGTEASKKTDVWALGIILYELLTGQRPVPETWDVPSKINNTSQPLDDVVRGCLEEAPDRRYQSATEVLAKVQAIVEAPRIAEELMVQRTTNRKLRNRLWFAVIAGGAAVIAGVLAMHKQVAEARARLVAEQTRQSAESLIEDMLGDLRQRLEEVGRLDLLESVTHSARSYFDHLPQTEWNASSSRNHAWTLKYYADVARKLGRTEDADKAYFSHADMLRKLHFNSPQQTELAREYAQALGEVGKVWETRGDLAKAESIYRSQLDLLSADESAHLEDAQTAVALASSLENIGFLYFRQGKTSQAEKAFNRQLEIFQQINFRGADDPEIQRNLAKSYGNLGDFWFYAADYSKARTNYEQQEQLLDDLAANLPDDMRIFNELAIAWNKLGKAFQALNKLEEAEVAFTQFHDKINHLARDVDPHHPDYQRSLSTSLANLGDIAFLKGDFSIAKGHYIEDLQITRQLARQFVDESSHEIDLGMSCVNMAKLLKSSGDPDKSRQFLQEAKGIALRVGINAPGIPQLGRLQARIEELENER